MENNSDVDVEEEQLLEKKQRKSRPKPPDVVSLEANSLNQLAAFHFLRKIPIYPTDVIPDERITADEWTGAAQKFKGKDTKGNEKTNIFDLSREEGLRMLSKDLPSKDGGYPLAWQGDCIVTPRSSLDLRLSAANGKKYLIQEVAFLAWKSEKQLGNRPVDSKVEATCANKTRCVGPDHLAIKEVKKRKAGAPEKSAGQKKKKNEEESSLQSDELADVDSDTAAKGVDALEELNVPEDDSFDSELSIPQTQDEEPPTQIETVQEAYPHLFAAAKENT